LSSAAITPAEIAEAASLVDSPSTTSIQAASMTEAISLMDSP
jgi:hypothetical protein